MHMVEPTTIADIKKYIPKTNSISNNQILFENYEYEDAYLVIKEMVELNVLDLVEKHVVCDHIGLYVGYAEDDVSSTGGMRKLSVVTNSYQILLKEFLKLFEETTNKDELIRQIGITFGNVVDETHEAYDIFTDYEDIKEERKLQNTLVEIKQKYGKNAILKGMNLCDAATTMKRNKLVGGHNAE